MIQLEDRLYTSTEVAEILGVSLRSVYRYIEEGKLDAEVKTATGRHRFTKQNITDFLYPTGGATQVTEKQAAPVQRATQDVKPVENVRESVHYTETSKPAPMPEPTPVKVENEFVEPEPQPQVKEEPVKQEEEPVDWLAKFREAAKKFEEERYKDEAPVAEPIHRPTANTITERPVERPAAPTSSKVYYRSRLGGLKDIAQNIDKSSRASDLDYAFTLNAGLSLFKPIKPFSMLHVYVKSKDREFFERSLLLTPSDANNAQLCLVISDDKAIYTDKEELHGLFVVSKNKLVKDIQASDDDVLKQEAESIIK